MCVHITNWSNPIVSCEPVTSYTVLGLTLINQTDAYIGDIDVTLSAKSSLILGEHKAGFHRESQFISLMETSSDNARLRIGSKPQTFDRCKNAVCILLLKSNKPIFH